MESAPPVPMPPLKLVYPVDDPTTAERILPYDPLNAMLSKMAPPTTWSFAVGVVVPTPSLPKLSITNIGVAAVEDPIAKRGVEPSVFELCIENNAHGVVVLIPTRPMLSMMKLVALDDPTTNCGAPLSRPFELMERRPHGVEDA